MDKRTVDHAVSVTSHALLLARARTISRQRGTALAGSLALMLFIIIVHWQQHAAIGMLTWFCANLLFVVWRVLRWRIAPFRADMSEFEVRGWLRESAFANGINGLIWGIGALAFLSDQNFGTFLIFILVLTSVVFGAAVSFATWFVSVVSFSVPVTLLAAVKIATLELAGSSLVAISCLPFLLFVLMVAANYSKLMTALITLDTRNATLLAESERRGAELERVSEEKSRFFASISHDLRQPLYAMGLLVEALGSRLTTDAQRKLYTDIRRSQRAMDDMFSSLLDISQLDSGALSIKPEHFDLGAMLNTLRAEFAPSAAVRGIEIKLPAVSPPLYSDPILISRVLRNLLSNAIKFTDQGEVSISAKQHQEQVIISVADTGKGIPVDQQEAVFAEYFQLHNPERDRSKGLGLGLAVVRRLCDLLNIRLMLESVPGQGSRISLVVAAGEATTHGLSPAQTEPHGFGGLHVVVIDDELPILHGMRLLLEDHQCQVTTAQSAQLALQDCGQYRRPPDIIISDFRLRGATDGIAAIASLRKNIDAELPALLMTGDTDPRTRERAAKAGLKLIYKPIEPAQLLTTISELVEQ